MSDEIPRLHPARTGDGADFLPLVYGELRRLAAKRLAEQPAGQTLQPTALVHEAWLKLTGNTLASWQGRTHFFRAAAEAMRHVLVDNARAKMRQKRGAAPRRVNLEEVDLASNTPPEMLLVLDEAIESLAREHAEEAELVKLRFYVGLSMGEIAETLGVSEKTVQRNWIHARAWLFREIRRQLED